MRAKPFPALSPPLPGRDSAALGSFAVNLPPPHFSLLSAQTAAFWPFPGDLPHRLRRLVRGAFPKSTPIWWMPASPPRPHHSGLKGKRKATVAPITLPFESLVSLRVRVRWVGGFEEPPGLGDAQHAVFPVWKEGLGTRTGQGACLPSRGAHTFKGEVERRYLISTLPAGSRSQGQALEFFRPLRPPMQSLTAYFLGYKWTYLNRCSELRSGTLTPA